MHESIREFTQSRSDELRVDREASILRGVKLLGLVSANARRYTEKALQEAIPLYERAKVNINHSPGGPLAPRDYRERIGLLRGVRLRQGEGLFADLHFNPKHSIAEQLLWDAENAPENVGLSHNVLAKTSREAGMTVIESITHVQSVDLVADPATTRGLFEQSESNAVEDKVATEAIDSPEIPLERREQVYELLVSYQLPLPGVRDEHAQVITSEAFLASLFSAPDETTLRRLIEERSKIVAAAKKWRSPEAIWQQPVARDQQISRDVNPFHRTTSGAREFAEAITG